MPHTSFHTPAGDITVFEDQGAVVALDWGWSPYQRQTALLTRTREQLLAYMEGELKEFNLPLAPSGSIYSVAVWRALQEIPFGQTCSYGQIARRVGGSARSVGQANGRNPIPIIIPCHRVVAEAHLGGYSGGQGIETKKWLLTLETGRFPLS